VAFYIDDYSSFLEEEVKIPIVPLKIDHSASNKSNFSVHSINENLYEDLFEKNLSFSDDHITLDDLKDASIDLIDITGNFKDYSSIGNNQVTTIKSGSTCSSRTSYTSQSEIDIENGSNPELEEANSCEDCDNSGENDKDEDDGEEWEDMESDDSEPVLEAIIPKFPVNIICMENCSDTFDNLILDDNLSEEEWFSAFMQIIMTLITYQKCFSFTHNDLHTNNVMYVETDKKFLYYCYDEKYYKVPTFGRIFKIIDFGRSIYRFQDKLFCSDSFQPGSDAATQYNTEPYLNEKKPRLDPNFSFDLCRLACSIFDYVIDDLSEIEDLDKCEPVIRLIVDWCKDDNHLNILYKTNGTERYPDFKLYKMIARCVHNHTPQAQLKRPEFSQFLISKKNITKNAKIMNIDKIPSFCSSKK
jgi:hypothetical protein